MHCGIASRSWPKDGERNVERVNDRKASKWRQVKEESMKSVVKWETSGGGEIRPGRREMVG